MKLGIFMMPVHPPEKSRTECYDEDIELLVRADELGFSEAWIGQHTSMAWEPIPANDLFISNVFPRTKNIRLGTGVTIVPHHHPVNIASRLALLDHLSHGRLNIGFGQSGVPTDWELFDMPDPKTQGAMVAEGIEMVLKLWESKAPFEFKGKFHRIRIDSPRPELGVGQVVKPLQQPHPPIGMSIVSPNSKAAHFAGLRGYWPLSTNLVPVNSLISHWETYAAGASEAGHSEPDRSLWRVSRSICIGETNEEAWDHALNGTFGGSFEYMLELMRAADMIKLAKHDPDVPDDDVDVEYALKHLCIVGDPDECLRQLHEVWDVTGGFGTLLMIAHDWDDKAKWLRTMDLLAKEIVPAMPTLEPADGSDRRVSALRAE